MCGLQGFRSRFSKRTKQAAAEAAPGPGRSPGVDHSRTPRYYAESNVTDKPASRAFDVLALHNRALRIIGDIAENRNMLSSKGRFCANELRRVWLMRGRTGNGWV